MKLALWIIVAALASAGAAFWAGTSTCRRRLLKRQERQEALRTAVELAQHTGLLEALRKGPAPDWVEVLEFSIDCDVAELWRQLPVMHPFNRDQALGTLQKVRQYRRKWPRQIAPIPERSEELQQSAREAAEEAGKILAELDAGAKPVLQVTATPPRG